MKKITDNLASIAALIGVLGAIGAGFIKYGEVIQKLDAISTPDLSPIYKDIKENASIAASQNTKIAVLEKTIKVLELEIQEFKVKNSNPLIR